MNFSTLIKSVAAAAACVSSLAHAVPVTYVFTGTTTDGLKSSVTGSLTIDTSTYTTTSSGANYQNGSSAVSSSASISFAGGPAYTIASGSSGSTSTTLIRSNNTNYFGLDDEATVGSTKYIFLLATYDFSSTASSTLFSTAASDVSLDQTVSFNTAGSSSIGSFSVGQVGSNSYVNRSFTIDSVSISSAVAAVPEPETYALMLAGLGAVGFIARRRQRV